MRHLVLVLVGLLSFTLLTGCGDDAKKKRSGVISGSLKYKGEAVNDAAILLYPFGSDKALPMTIPVDWEGNFVITDAIPGTYHVVVQGADGKQHQAADVKHVPPERRAEMEKKLEGFKTAKTPDFPKRYASLKTTNLQIEITQETQDIDIELKD